jgi:type II secretory pathway pseudopilin PulG
MRHDSRGFTLIETLTASAVLLFGIAAVAGLVSVSVRTRARAEWQSRAQSLTAARLEALRLEIRAGAPSGGTLEAGAPAPGFHDYLRLAPDGEPVGAVPAEGRFLRMWQVSSGEPVRIGVAVYWQPGSGRAAVPLARAETALAGVR